MPLSAFPLNLQPSGEMFFISAGNYLKRVTQQKRDFLIRSCSAHERGPTRWILCLMFGVIPVGMFFTTAGTDSLPGSCNKACLRNLPQRQIGTNSLRADCSWQRGAGLIQTASDLLFQALLGLSCPLS